MDQPATVGGEFAKPQPPNILMGQLIDESLEALLALLGPGVTDVAAYYVTHAARESEDAAPTHHIFFTYVDEEGHVHAGIGVEDPNNGHSSVVADVIVAW